MRSPNFARLNHVLIPATKEGRDRLRSGWAWKLAWPIAGLYGALTDEGRTVGVLSVVVGAFGIDVRNTEIHVLWAMLAAALVASVLVRPLYALGEGVSAELSLPRRVLVREELVFGVTIHNHGARDLHALRVSGPFLPWDGRWAGSDPGVSRLNRGQSARVELRARFVSRGEHHLDPFHASALVPLGLARGRSVATTGARFLVLPRIARIARLTLPELRREQTGGVALASKSGESMELLGVRPYRPGDPVRHLHARSWARTGMPIVREYQEELFRRIAVVVDVDGKDEVCAEAALSLAAGVVAHLARGQSLIDLLVTGERVHELTLGRSLGFLEQALELLACVQLRPPSPGTSSALLAQLEQHLPRLSSVVVIDAGARSAALVERARASGVGCLWLRVERGGQGTDGAGALRLDPDVIERDEELML